MTYRRAGAKINNSPGQNSNQRLFHTTDHNTQKKILFVDRIMEKLYITLNFNLKKKTYYDEI